MVAKNEAKTKTEMVLCICSGEVTTTDGRKMKIQKGAKYDAALFRDDTIKAFMEHPVKAPPKGMQTREG